MRPYGCVRRTAGSAVGERDKIYLGDTMGELPLMLAAADLAFVGGSLVPVGGHNLLEPAALGKPCLTGPVYFNFSDITRQLVAQGRRRGGGRRGARRPGERLARRCPCPPRDGEQARAVVLRNQGALARTLSHCLASLESDD